MMSKIDTGEYKYLKQILLARNIGLTQHAKSFDAGLAMAGIVMNV
jgi:hypothetical protein